MGIADKIFGGVGQTSTLTKGQRGLLSQLGGLQQQYNGGAYEGLNNSAYEYDADNGAAAFQSGVVNPAMQQLNRQLGNAQHSSMLHSSANRYAQDQMRQNTMNSLNNLQYQNMLQQQQMKQQAGENAYGRQMSALQGLLAGNQNVLGTKGVGLQRKPGLLDLMSAGGSLMQGVGSIMGAGVGGKK